VPEPSRRFPAHPRWWADPHVGDVIDVPDGRSREVIGRPEGRVEFRDHYGIVMAIGLASWRAWANRNGARIKHYGD
jgi:hypothetical protein